MLCISLLLLSPLFLLQPRDVVLGSSSENSDFGLPFFLPTGSIIDGAPSGWSSPEGTPPNTGVTRYYNLTISRAFKSPDGYKKRSIVVNDQFPGPAIEANWGDMISVTVVNDISDPKEGATVHWHGLSQQLTPWYDGVPGISQCPIPPQENFTYTFQASSYGTSWWHSHVSGRYIDGIWGAIVIYGPSALPYDIDLGPILLTDYTHVPYFPEISAIYDKPPDFLAGATNLINGQSNSNNAIFQFQPGKMHRLRLINSGGAGSQKFSIDEHEMEIIANDFVPIVPYKTKVVTLGIGQRTDVLVRGKETPNNAYWMRSDIDPSCLNVSWTQLNALAIVYYPEANLALKPNTTATPWASNNCANDPLDLTSPLYSKSPSEPATTHNIDINASVNETGYLVFTMNNSSAQIDYKYSLPEVSSHLDGIDLTPSVIHHCFFPAWGNDSYPDDPKWNIYDFGTNTSTRVVLHNYFPVVHPMHLHGHDPWILAEGVGEWNGSIVNPRNPQRRDTQLLQPGSPDEPSYIVLQWNADNPDVWPLHCHVVIHVSAGLLVNVMERPDLIQSQRRIPPSSSQLCKQWADFTQSNFVDQIDSGL